MRILVVSNLYPPQELGGYGRSIYDFANVLASPELANLRTLNADLMREKLGRWLDKLQLEGLLARRDLIVQFFEKEIAAKGEAAVLYDFPRTSESCGAGLQ